MPGAGNSYIQFRKILLDKFNILAQGTPSDMDENIVRKCETDYIYFRYWSQLQDFFS